MTSNLKIQLTALAAMVGVGVAAPGKVDQFEGALEARVPSCAACHGHENVLWQDDFRDVGFCGECLEQVRTRVPYAELGGEC